VIGGLKKYRCDDGGKMRKFSKNEWKIGAESSRKCSRMVVKTRGFLKLLGIWIVKSRILAFFGKPDPWFDLFGIWWGTKKISKFLWIFRP
jgi:hypothetical protein